MNWKLTKSSTYIKLWRCAFSIFLRIIIKIYPYEPIQSNQLKSTLSINQNMDISQYSKLIASFKRRVEGYIGKKSKTLLPNEIYIS